MAYATDLEAIHRAVFYQRGDIASGYFPPVSPWHASPEGWKGKYDPEKAKFLLQQAKAMGTPIILMSTNRPAYFHQTGELLQALCTTHNGE